MIRRPPRSTLSSSSAASDVYKRQRTGKLDAYKGQIVRWLDAHPYSAQQIFQRLREAGFDGGVTIVKDYVHRIWPRHQEAFLKLDFAPGEAAQVDWGEYGTIGVG